MDFFSKVLHSFCTSSIGSTSTSIVNHGGSTPQISSVKVNPSNGNGTLLNLFLLALTISEIKHRSVANLCIPCSFTDTLKKKASASSSAGTTDHLIRAHGILMVVAWPVLAASGIFFAGWMKPVQPKGWFQVI